MMEGVTNGRGRWKETDMRGEYRRKGDKRRREGIEDATAREKCESRN